MQGFETFLTILLVINALSLMVLIVVLQSGQEGGFGSAFGAGNTSGFFGASGGVNFIVKATWVAGALFFILSMVLAKVKTEIYAPDLGAKVEDLGVPLPEPQRTPAPAPKTTPAADTGAAPAPQTAPDTGAAPASPAPANPAQ